MKIRRGMTVVSLSVLIGTFTFQSDAYGARNSTCKRDRNEVPIVIKSVVAQSARRIQVYSEPGVYLGTAVEPTTFEILDQSGSLLHTYRAGSNASDSHREFFMEGLIPGRTYKVVASGSYCATKSSAVSVTMPPQAAESVLPMIDNVHVWYGQGMFSSSNPYLHFKASDNSAVAGYRILANGTEVARSSMDLERGWFRGWSNSYFCQPGSKFNVALPYAYKDLLVEVTIEVTDSLGNRQTRTQNVQF